MIAQGVLVPGFNASNPDWPHLSLTDYGETIRQQSAPTPADPEGFLNRLGPFVANDPIIKMYVSEAVAALNRHVFLAAAVMLGVAAEALMLALADEIRTSFGNPKAGQEWYDRKIASRLALRQHEAISRRLDTVLQIMPGQLAEKLDTHLRGIQSLIRQHRNEAGHPTGARKDRDEVLPLFYLFVGQTKFISDLIEWLKTSHRF